MWHSGAGTHEGSGGKEALRQVPQGGETGRGPRDVAHQTGVTAAGVVQPQHRRQVQQACVLHVGRQAAALLQWRNSSTLINNNNGYLERLTCTDPKRLHIL